MPRHAHPWYRRSDGWWYVKINGKLAKLARGRQNAPAAIARWHELMAERSLNPPLDSDDHTVASVIELFLTHVKRKYAERTYEERYQYLQRFAEAHGFRRVRDCRPIHLTMWLHENRQWASDWTLATVVKIVQRPFNWAARQRIIAANPFQGVTHRQGEPRRAMTGEEFQALLRATGTCRTAGWPRRRSPKRPSRAARFRQVLIFLRYTGARPSEMAGLTWDDVDLDAGVIVLRHHKTSRTQRRARPRVIPIVPVVARLLARIRRQQSAEATRVFLNARGNPWDRSNLSLRMQRLRKRAVLSPDVKLYGVRHQFGTQAIVNGVDIKTLAELMGHTSTRMTEHYCHLAGQRAHLASAMQRAVGRRQDG
jgi:site-specific recombinase XerD